MLRRAALPALLLAVVFPARTVGQWDSTTAGLLQRGDTGTALARLRVQVRINDTPQSWCALARVLTSMATTATSAWRIRYEATEAFARGLRGGDVQCSYAYALLKEKQGTRADALRMLRRVEARLAGDSAETTTAFRAELLYRRALLMDDWLRNFDFLVNYPGELPVNTPDCAGYGSFCLNFARPRYFNERFLHAPSLASVIGDERREVVHLLDSALALDPGHAEAARLRLRRALVEGDWKGFATLAGQWVQIDSGSVAALLAVLAAQVHQAAYREAGRTLAAIDSLIPDSLRTAFERLAVISRGADMTRAAELWELSDPLYLTGENERRVQLYARLALADIVFTDPTDGVVGRDTQPGKLLLRYGWPAHIWEVTRDMGKEEAGTGFTTFQGGGRWTFFNYDLDLPSFVFERNLSEREFEYKRFTLTEQLDSNLARILPSSFDNPYRAGSLTALVTRFPRPEQPALEVHARFSWQAAELGMEDAEVGVFVHDRRQAQLVNRGTATQKGPGWVKFGAVLPVVRGPLQVAVEGLTKDSRISAQVRTNLEMPLAGGLALSDLLLGSIVGDAPEVSRRTDIRLVGRTDTLPEPGSELTMYWETYGLTVADDSTVRWTVTVRLSETEGGRTPGGEVVRVLGRVTGLRGRPGAITWERRQRADAQGYAADVLTLRLPSEAGAYRLVVSVHDDVADTTATTERVLTLTR